MQQFDDLLPQLRDLYPEATEEQIREAHDNLIQDVALSLRMYERLETEGKMEEMMAKARTIRRDVETG